MEQKCEMEKHGNCFSFNTIIFIENSACYFEMTSL